MGSSGRSRATTITVILRESGGSSIPKKLGINNNGRSVLGRPVKPDDDSCAHTVNRAPSFPLIVNARTAPGVSPDIATGKKCSVRPCLPLSIRT